MIDLFPFFSNYLQSQIDYVNYNLTHLSIGYFYLFIAFVAYIYRKTLL